SLLSPHPPPPSILPLSLHDALPISVAAKQGRSLQAVSVSVAGVVSPDEPFAKTMADRCGFSLRILRPSLADLIAAMPAVTRVLRSEEHTSELPSLTHLVCPLLLEKK